ncbi:MAG: hypothetical protein ACRENK_16500 [Gemmatimonadaceae bacterium]
MRNDDAKLSGFGTAMPGRAALTLNTDVNAEMGSVSLWASVPNRGLPAPAFVRFNMFAVTANERQHVASAFAVPGTMGELIVVSGHIVDSYEVWVQATNPRQDIKVNLTARACCAEPSVQVRPDLLSLAMAPPETGLGELQWFPVMPWGPSGAPGLVVVAGSGTATFPTGSRLTHWQALGQAPGGTLAFNGLATGTPFSVGQALPEREGFPAPQLITSITYANLVYGLFEFVV